MSLCQKADQKAVNHISLTNNHLVQFSVDIINKYAILFDAFSQELHIGMIAHVCTIGLFKFYSGFTDSGPMCSAVQCDQKNKCVHRSNVIKGTNIAHKVQSPSAIFILKP